MFVSILKSKFSFVLALVLALVLGLGFSFSALAHHSAAQFDFAQNVTVAGKVKFVAIENPHIDLILEVDNGDGTTRDIRFEGHSRNNVYRRGWRPGMVEEGDMIEITIAPMRNGEDGGYIGSFNANGNQF